MKILLLEGVHPVAADLFSDAGYTVSLKKEALSPSQLKEELPNVHVLGIRSKTQVTKEALTPDSPLLAIGAFCIGTDQVDLNAAAASGVPVFNAPFSNTRSVAELTMAEVVMLARQAAYKNFLMHQGRWDKSSKGSVEVRNKSIGIVGYGHIGPQVGLLAEAFGMKVYFYDIVNKLPLGNAIQLRSLEELLAVSDFVTLHVPDTATTRGMIGAAELSNMKKGAYLLNLSRGSVVDISSLSSAIREGHLAGAAVDVFPKEPHSNEEPFSSELIGLPNVILTPHIGGSTAEAQRNIGIEVSDTLLKFVETGSTTGAVNFPEVELPLITGGHRVLNIHRNVPGVLSSINQIIARLGVNIRAQYLKTFEHVGYLIMDVEQDLSATVKSEIDALSASIKTRLLF